ncbi:MAG: YraN family protein [Terracidiphilus sp.]
MEERALDGLAGFARRHVAEWKNMPQHLFTGHQGERAAFFHLRRTGHIVVARRWSSGSVPGDIDLIAWKDSLLCFIEVKTRTGHGLTPAEFAVDAHKRHMIRRLARHYIRQLPQEVPPQARFDVLSVYLLPDGTREFFHFENAFGWDEQRRE